MDPHPQATYCPQPYTEYKLILYIRGNAWRAIRKEVGEPIERLMPRWFSQRLREVSECECRLLSAQFMPNYDTPLDYREYQDPGCWDLCEHLELTARIDGEVPVDDFLRCLRSRLWPGTRVELYRLSFVGDAQRLPGESAD